MARALANTNTLSDDHCAMPCGCEADVQRGRGSDMTRGMGEAGVNYACGIGQAAGEKGQHYGGSRGSNASRGCCTILSSTVAGARAGPIEAPVLGPCVQHVCEYARCVSDEYALTYGGAKSRAGSRRHTLPGLPEDLWNSERKCTPWTPACGCICTLYVRTHVPIRERHLHS